MITAALGRIATLTSLDLSYTDIGVEGARFSDLPWTRTRILQQLDLSRDSINKEGDYVMEDRHRFYKLVLKLASWVASAGRLRSTRRRAL